MKKVYAIFTLASALHGQCVTAVDVDKKIDAIAASIAKYEGWLPKNTLTHLLHNPGALSYAGQRGATRDVTGYAQFQSDAEGWAALRRDLRLKFCSHMSLGRVLSFWNSAYAWHVAAETGIPLNAVLN